MFRKGYGEIYIVSSFFYYLKATLADIRENNTGCYENKKLNI